MLRIAIKLPGKGLSRLQNHGASRIYIATRHNSSKGGKSGGGGSPILFMLGTVTIATGATVAYANFDPEFRQWLGTTVPYSEGFIKAALQEENSYSDQLMNFINNAKESIWQSLFGKDDKIRKTVTTGGVAQIIRHDDPCIDLKEKPDYKPPRSVFSQLLNEKTGNPEKPWKEIRVLPDESEEPVIVTSEKEPKLDVENVPEGHPLNLVELETRISGASALAVNSFTKACCALREHSQEIYQLVETSVENVNPKIWPIIKEKSEKKEKLVKESIEAGQDAVGNIKTLKAILESGQIDAPADLIECAKRNVVDILADIDKAIADLEKERECASVTEKYWKKVEAARLHWTEEMDILFPGINLKEKDLRLATGDLDLFIIHAYKNVLFYQKELKKLETIGECRLKQALAASGEGANEEHLQAQIQWELEKERRNLALQFQKDSLCLKAETERDMRRLMKRQAEAHADHIAEAVAAKEKEVERRFKRKADESVSEEQAKYKLQMAAVVGRMRGMDAALKARADADKTAHASQVLWSACQALFSSLKNNAPGSHWSTQLRPLSPEICAVKTAAAQEDDLVKVVIKGIPAEAFNRGVFTEDALRERFLKVERVARQVALVPETGGKLYVYLLSYLQSFLLIRAVSPIPVAELSDQPVDFSALDTYDVLQRARYWLDRGDFTMTLKYMNLLKGASRKIACDWMNETRILLETQQAANTLMAHAAASGLLYL